MSGSKKAMELYHEIRARNNVTHSRYVVEYSTPSASSDMRDNVDVLQVGAPRKTPQNAYLLQVGSPYEVLHDDDAAEDDADEDDADDAVHAGVHLDFSRDIERFLGAAQVAQAAKSKKTQKQGWWKDYCDKIDTQLLDDNFGMWSNTAEDGNVMKYTDKGSHALLIFLNSLLSV